MADAREQRAGEGEVVAPGRPPARRGWPSRAAGLIGSIVIWALVGAVLSVLVAWAVATWIPRRTLGFSTATPTLAMRREIALPPEFEGSVDVAERHEVGLDARSVRAERVTSPLREPLHIVPRDASAEERAVEAARRQAFRGSTIEVWTTSRWRFGLPWRALGFELVMAPDEADAWRGALTAGHGVGRMCYDNLRRLPLRPLEGLIADAAFWGSIAWLLVGVPRALRRRGRARRGLCRWCGYPAGASPVCTECGRPILRVRVAVVGAAVERWALRLLGAAALGAITTIVVAWAIAAATPWTISQRIALEASPRGLLLDGTTWDVFVQRSRGAEYVCVEQFKPYGWSAAQRNAPRVDPIAADLQNQWAMTDVPAWALPFIPRVWALGDAPVDYEWSAGYAAYGWPARGMMWRQSGARAVGSWDVPSKALVIEPNLAPGGMPSGRTLRAIPLEIRWVAFAIDTAALGAAWLALLALVDAIAGRRRRRRAAKAMDQVIGRALRSGEFRAHRRPEELSGESAVADERE